MRIFLRMMCVWMCGVAGVGMAIVPVMAQIATMPVTMSTTAAQNGAMIVSLATPTPKATIYYTLDGSVPTVASMKYEAPFLVASNLTVKAFALYPGYAPSTVTVRSFSLNIAPGTLVWSDEFTGTGAGQGQPSPEVWTYDVGKNCCGNHELETYCAWGSAQGPCDPAHPNAFVGGDGYLHVVGRNPAAGVYTSGRLKSAGHFSFMYGRVEARMKLPESQGMWPAFWLLGNNIEKVGWPACGELDVMEHINGNNSPLYVGGKAPGYDWIAGSVHGGTSGRKELNGTEKYHPAGFVAADWHTYGMIWKPGLVQFYVDSPANVYATFTPTNGEFTQATWPFDAGPQFLILNLALGGDWPGNPDATTVLPAEMLVDYVRIYTP
jgi:hypothetical protein